MKILVAILTVLVSQMAQASFLESCQFDMKVVEVGAIVQPTATQPNYSRKVLAEVVKAEDKGGHISCDVHIGQEYDMNLISASLLDVALLNSNHRVLVDYFYVNSLGPDGVFESTSFTIVSAAQTAFTKVINHKGVFHKIREVKQKLENGGGEVVLLAGVSQGLQEGFCGFAGCSSVHLVTLTFGEDFMNSARETILVKVIQSALGESVTVEILN